MSSLNRQQREPTHRLRSARGTTWTADVAPRDVWTELLDRAVDPIHTQTPLWMDAAVAATGGADASRLYTSGTGRQMILPLLRQGSLPRVRRYASLPHGLGYAGLLSDEPVDADDVGVVVDDLQRLPALSVKVRTGPLQDAWQAVDSERFESSEHVLHMVDISGGFEHVWTTVFGGSLRTKIRKGEKVGLVVECDSTGTLIPVFYELYEQWLEERAERRGIPRAVALRLGRRAEPRKKFESVARVLGEGCQVWVASLDGVVIAANIQLTFGAQSSYWRGYSLRAEAGRTRATYLLQSKMIEDACRRGCLRYDMGESGGVDSLMDFKTRFGASPQTYDELYLERVPLTRAADAVGSLRSRVERMVVSRRSSH